MTYLPYKDSVILMGGWDAEGDARTEFLTFDPAEREWVVLSESLDIPRDDHGAVQVPYDYCT